MQINVSQLLKESIGSTRDYQADELIDITGDSSDLGIQGKVSLLHTHRGILMKGKLHTEVRLNCSRCLRSFYYPVTLKVEEEYLPTIDITSGVPLSSSEELGSFIIDEHHVIDLTEAIRQYSLLAIPMKPLCREDCTGLYPSCGHNLNRGPYGYLPRAADPRWSELSKLP
ncbi:MAG: DUF177 domain-containing protein [Dehalococcoidales bacterium]|jgi:uncharacterized protein|nr:DUF177 domain-containing protein [Dehalococcoidales bacterium]